jgi:hypothetical protein
VNPNLSTAECDALLEVLERGMVQIRISANAGNAARAEEIADALHNVPRLISEGQKFGWTVASFRELFLEPLIESSPDLAGLAEPLDALGSKTS